MHTTTDEGPFWSRHVFVLISSDTVYRGLHGDLVNRIHQEAEIGSMEHTGEGTVVVGRANPDLAGELEAYAR